jgi:hypothetical protein
VTTTIESGIYNSKEFLAHQLKEDFFTMIVGWLAD